MSCNIALLKRYENKYPPCPNCDSTDIVKHGYTKNRRTPRYKCKRCGKAYIEPEEKERILRKEIANKFFAQKKQEEIEEFFANPPVGF